MLQVLQLVMSLCMLHMERHGSVVAAALELSAKAAPQEASAGM